MFTFSLSLTMAACPIGSPLLNRQVFAASSETTIYRAIPENACIDAAGKFDRTFTSLLSQPGHF
jgi:hypothetical protein